MTKTKVSTDNSSIFFANLSQIVWTNNFLLRINILSKNPSFRHEDKFRDKLPYCSFQVGRCVTTPYKMTSSMHRFPIRDILYFSRGFPLFFPSPRSNNVPSSPRREERGEEVDLEWSGRAGSTTAIFKKELGRRRVRKCL